MSSYRAASSRARTNVNLQLQRVQAGTRKIAVAGDKTIFDDTNRLRSYGATTIPTSNQIARFDAEQLYEIAFGGDANYFESQSFDEQKDQEQQYLQNVTRTINVEASVHECPRCQYNRVIVSPKQLRSGDEGVTTLLRCTRCAYEWRKD